MSPIFTAIQKFGVSTIFFFEKKLLLFHKDTLNW